MDEFRHLCLRTFISGASRLLVLHGPMRCDIRNSGRLPWCTLALLAPKQTEAKGKADRVRTPLFLFSSFPHFSRVPTSPLSPPPRFWSTPPPRSPDSLVPDCSFRACLFRRSVLSVLPNRLSPSSPLSVPLPKLPSTLVLICISSSTYPVEYSALLLFHAACGYTHPHASPFTQLTTLQPSPSPKSPSSTPHDPETQNSRNV